MARRLTSICQIAMSALGEKRATSGYHLTAAHDPQETSTVARLRFSITFEEHRERTLKLWSMRPNGRPLDVAVDVHNRTSRALLYVQEASKGLTPP